MAAKQKSPLRGPLVTLALMLASAAVVVAIADAIDSRQKAPEPTLATSTANGAAGHGIHR